MIKRLAVEHFRSIGHIDIQLRNTSVFVGPNATGKSNIIDAIRFLNDAMVYGLDRAVSDRQGIDTTRQWSPTKPYHLSLEVELEVRHGHGRYRITIGSKRGNYIVVAEVGAWTRRVPRYREERGDFVETTPGHETINFDRKGDTVLIRAAREGVSKGELKVEVEFADELFLRSPFPLFRADDNPQSYPIVRSASALNMMRRALSDFELIRYFPTHYGHPRTQPTTSACTVTEVTSRPSSVH